MSVHAVDGKEVTGAKEVFKNGGADDISLTLVKQLLPRKRALNGRSGPGFSAITEAPWASLTNLTSPDWRRN